MTDTTPIVDTSIETTETKVPSISAYRNAFRDHQVSLSNIDINPTDITRDFLEEWSKDPTTMLERTFYHLNRRTEKVTTLIEVQVQILNQETGEKEIVTGSRQLDRRNDKWALQSHSRTVSLNEWMLESPEDRTHIVKRYYKLMGIEF